MKQRLKELLMLGSIIVFIVTLIICWKTSAATLGHKLIGSLLLYIAFIFTEMEAAMKTAEPIE